MTSAYTLRNIEFAYGSDVVLRVDSLTIEPDSIHALLGANGSGKTTLLNLLALINLPTNGELLFFDEVVSAAEQGTRRRQTAYVQQKPYLFNFNVRQNIELGLKLRGVDRVERKRRSDEISLQLGIEHLMNKRAQDLSGGEIQKIAIARALILDPDVLLLDEPFTYLDAQSRQGLERLLVDIKNTASRTVVFSTHDQLQAWHLASHVNHLGEGRLDNTARINTFSGTVDREQHIFDTGRQKIHLADGVSAGSHIAIDANQLVVSKTELQSSMRNRFRGRVVAMEPLDSAVQLLIEAGEHWYANVTQAATEELKLSEGMEIWLSFKSTALQIF